MTQLPQLPFPAVPPTANICHFHTKLGVQETHKLHTCTHKVEADTSTCGICIHASTPISLINTETDPLHTLHIHTHPPHLCIHTQKKLCSSHLASSSLRLYFNLQERGSPRSQRGIQELRLRCHMRTHIHTWTCKTTGTHSSTVRNEQWGKVEVGRISILNEPMVKKRTIWHQGAPSCLLVVVRERKDEWINAPFYQTNVCKESQWIICGIIYVHILYVQLYILILKTTESGSGEGYWRFKRKGVMAEQIKEGEKWAKEREKEIEKKQRKIDPYVGYCSLTAPLLNFKREPWAEQRAEERAEEREGRKETAGWESQWQANTGG